jgi:hypothetical protein
MKKQTNREMVIKARLDAFARREKVIEELNLKPEPKMVKFAMGKKCRICGKINVIEAHECD